MRKIAWISVGFVLIAASAGCHKDLGGGGGKGTACTSGVPIRGHDGGLLIYRNTVQLDLSCQTPVLTGGNITGFTVVAKDQTYLRSYGPFSPALPAALTSNWNVAILDGAGNFFIVAGNSSTSNPPTVPITINAANGNFTPEKFFNDTYLFHNSIAGGNETLASITVNQGGTMISRCNGASCEIDLGMN